MLKDGCGVECMTTTVHAGQEGRVQPRDTKAPDGPPPNFGITGPDQSKDQ